MAIAHRLSRRTFLRMSGLATLSLPLAACALPATAQPPAATLAPEPAVTTAEQAIQRLIEGNQRYAANTSNATNESVIRRTEVAQGQQPFATIFSCVDSRVPPELVFDRGLGDLFVIRTAGHVLDSAVLGSLEFGVAELHIPLLMVVGHEKCGAVKATIEAIETNAKAEADIQWLVDGIRPAVEQSHGQAGDLLDNAVKANIALTVRKLKGSPILAEAIEQGKLTIVGAQYDLDSGLVVMVPA